MWIICGLPFIRNPVPPPATPMITSRLGSDAGSDVLWLM